MDDISRQAFRRLQIRLFASLATPTMDRVEWCESVRRLESGAPFRFDFAPYQIEPFEAIGNPELDVVVLCWASRMGKTELILNDLGFRILEDPRRMIVAYPTDTQAEDFSKDNFTTQLVSQTGPLFDLVGDGTNRRLSSNTVRTKFFPGGKIDFVGLNVAGKLRKLKANWIGADEIDAIRDEISDEGDKLAILKKRGAEFSDLIFILSSYPSLAGNSQIWDWLEKSDFREWKVNHCGKPFVLHRRQITWAKGKPKTAELVCPCCAKVISPKAWRDLWMGGQWIARNPKQTNIRGYHINAMSWPHPHQEAFKNYFHQIAAQMEGIETADNPERERRVLVNTFDAQPYDPPAIAKPEAEEIARRRENYQPKMAAPASNS